MNPTSVGLISAGLIFGGTLLGLTLSRLLPNHHFSSESKDAIKVGAGMVSMMSALVLGLLVSSAKNNFESASDALTQGSAKVIVIDRLLAVYGEDAREIRHDLRRSVAVMLEVLWPARPGARPTFAAFENAKTVERLLDNLRNLKPQNEAQSAIKSQAMNMAQDLMLSRWVQIEQAQAPLPPVLLGTLLFWLTMLFTCFGLLAPRNGTVMVVLFVGALSVASAVFLVLELNQPMDGLIKIPNGPVVKALQFLDR